MKFSTTPLIVYGQSGQKYKLGISDLGGMTATTITGGTINDAIQDANGELWQLSISPSNTLAVSDVGSASPAVPTNPALVSPSGKVFAFLVIPPSGFATKYVGTTAVVGILVPPNDSYPPAVQPGGVGTQVTFPKQQIGEQMGQWSFGCGHFADTVLVQTYSDMILPQSALICCPLCGFVNSVVTPYSLIHSDAYFVLFP